MISITIITVVKNNSEEILKTLSSINNQTYDNFEHIIIDSNSTDGTSEIIDRFNFKIKTIYLRENDNGIYQALNKGIRKARGKFIGVLHSGDVFFCNDTLNKISKKIENFDAVFGAVAYYNRNKINRVWNFNQNYNNDINPLKIPHTSLFIKKSFFEAFGYYNEKYKISADLDFLLSLKNKNLNFLCLNKTLVFMKSGGKSYSYKNFFTKFKEDFFILYKYYKLFCIFVYIYKIIIKIKGLSFLTKKKYIQELEVELKNNLKEN